MTETDSWFLDTNGSHAMFMLCKKYKLKNTNSCKYLNLKEINLKYIPLLFLCFYFYQKLLFYFLTVLMQLFLGGWESQMPRKHKT